MTQNRNHNKLNWQTFLTPQAVIYFFAAFAWAVIFWKDSKQNWDKVKDLEVQIKDKSDNADLKATSERVNRQYEMIIKMGERIEQLEKDASYQKGLHESIQHLETEKQK